MKRSPRTFRAAGPTVSTSEGATGVDRAGMSLVGAVSLASVVLVLIFVSLPRLRCFAQNENEADARATARLLARELGAAIQAAGELGEVPPGTPPIARLTAKDSVARALSDSDLLEEGALIRRHGYLFRVVRVAAPTAAPPRPGEVLAATSEPGLAILAWPWEWGRTGHDALLATPDDRLYAHENAGAVWTGCGASAGRVVRSWEGWRPVP